MSTEAKAKVGTGFQASKFTNGRDRNQKALAKLRILFDLDESESTLTDEDQTLLQSLLGRLKQDPPEASAAAEAALTILSISLAEERKLDITSSESTDLAGKPNEPATRRLPGDRTIGDKLSTEILDPLHIPATRGAFQSSSYRAGYTAAQVRDQSLGQFITWYTSADRTFKDLVKFATALAFEFKKRAVTLPPLPEIAAARLTFSNFRQLRGRLLNHPSGGAYEQYLLAALLDQEASTWGNGYRAATKNVIANDTAKKSSGDVEIRRGQTLIKAYEVTANSWMSKLAQVDASAKSGLDEITIVARGVSPANSQGDLNKLSSTADRIGVDISILDLESFIDVIVSRLSRHARSDALKSLYLSLARWHRRNPELVYNLIKEMKDLDLIHVEKRSVVPKRDFKDIGEELSLLAEKVHSTEQSSDLLSQRLRDLADMIDAEGYPSDISYMPNNSY